jgi:hypothetical protein
MHSPPQKHPRRGLIFILLCALSVALLTLIKKLPHRGPENTSPAPLALTNKPPPTPETHPLQDLIAVILGQPAHSSPPEKYAELGAVLKYLPRDQASHSLIEFLDSKADRETHLPFKVTLDGSLSEAPSLRVFLLDKLAQIDPARAAAYSRNLLSQSNSPDEWAVALRNYARVRQDAEARSFLEDKTKQMLTNPDWLSKPSDGFLESFDLIVHLGGTNLVPLVAELTRDSPNPPVAYAAYLALDRLVIAQPAQTLALFQVDTHLLDGRERTRADFFARVDLEDLSQKILLERYLLDPARDLSEIESFAGIFPNLNFVISRNLLTKSSGPDGATLARRNEAALIAVTDWLNDPRFQMLSPHLRRIHSRLTRLITTEHQPHF